MDIQDLGQDRFLRKDPDQSDQTKGAIYVALNPTRSTANTPGNQKTGSPNSNEGPNSAQNIWTGTVITAAIIQTSALPSRAELSGNDLTLYDDTIAKNGRVQGDTSRIVFTHASADNAGDITSGFILQKRALSTNTYDNVLELFSPDNAPNTNFVFIGRMGTGAERNISVIEIDPDYRSAVGDSAGYINGVFRVRTSRDGQDNNFRDGLYVMDRGTESASRNGSVEWLVAAGEGGQVRLSYMPNRDGNPLTDSIFDIFVSSVGISVFGLPTSTPGGSGRLWNNAGVLNIT